MSDETDLVNRLRQRATMLPGILPASSWQGVCAEAAAELARLRQHVALLDFKIDRERDIAESLRAEVATLREKNTRLNATIGILTERATDAEKRRQWWVAKCAEADGEIATLRADLALCREREGMTGLEYRGG